MLHADQFIFSAKAQYQDFVDCGPYNIVHFVSVIQFPKEQRHVTAILQCRESQTGLRIQSVSR